jgi:hypothetical protein
MLHSPCPYVDSAMRSCPVPAGSFLLRFAKAGVTLGEACWITITHPGCRWGCKCYILHVPMLTARCAAVWSQRGRSCSALEAAVTLGEACWITITHPGCRWGCKCYILHVPMLTARCAAVGSQRGRSCSALEAAVTLGEACWITITHPGCRWGCKCYILHVPMLTARCAAVGSQRGRSCCALERLVTLGEACWITITHPGCRWGCKCYILHVPFGRLRSQGTKWVQITAHCTAKIRHYNIMALHASWIKDCACPNAGAPRERPT